jgi:FkbM family methyltransferase
MTFQKGSHYLKGIVRAFLGRPAITLRYNSYSQAGEDRILKFLFDTKGVVHPKYLELGVYKPDIGSNTFLFYLAGSTGVCVEADASLVNQIRSVRPRDLVLNVGVGIDDDQEKDFYVFSEPSLNTMDKGEADFRVSQGTYSIERVDQIEMMRVDRLIRENFHKVPDLLSIDIEGLDLEVLKTIDYSVYPIPVICAETCTYSENYNKPKDRSIELFLTQMGYFVYADTYINTIFVHKDWFYNVD